MHDTNPKKSKLNSFTDAFDIVKAPLSKKLNIEVDKQSKLFLKEHKGKWEPHHMTPTFPAMKAFLSINNMVIQNNIQPKLETREFK